MKFLCKKFAVAGEAEGSLQQFILDDII